MISAFNSPNDLTSFLKLDGPNIFVTHASYEYSRALKIASLNWEPVKFTQSIIISTIDSLNEHQKYKECHDELIKELTKSCISEPIQIRSNRPDLIKMTQSIHALLEPILNLEQCTIIIDASVFPKDRLWTVIDYFKRIPANHRLVVMYTEPDKYDSELHTDGWLSKGVKRIIDLPGFNGHQDANKESLLILVVGHEQERMQITLKNKEPDKIVLIGQGLQQHNVISSLLPTEIINQLGYDYRHIVDTAFSYSIGSRDFLGIRDAIRTVTANFVSTHNIMIASYGTKIQSVGALLACRENRALQALYAEPQVYNRDDYSKGAGSSWMLEIQ